jgi:3,4-dihydroxybenzoate---[aryl-carrier protein] ligase
VIVVNHTRYTKNDFEARYAQISQMEVFRTPSGRLYAICVQDAFDAISSVLFLKQNGGSVLLFHAETPQEQVLEKATVAGCYAVLFGKWDAVTLLGDSLVAEEPSLYQLSSGTTGLPKLLQRSWAEVDLEVASYNERLRDATDETPIVLVPVSHSFGLISGVLSALQREAEPIIVQNKNPKFPLSLIRQYSKSMVFGVPFQFHLLHSLAEAEFRFHRIISAGAPFTESLLQELQSRSHILMNQYGCTEAGCISFGGDVDSPKNVGQPLSSVELMAGRDKNSPQEIKLYFPKFDKTIETHDLGYLSETGQLHVLGRVDDVVIVSGLNVYPAEVENVIAKMTEVSEVAVYKTKHPVWGEGMAAQVVAETGITAKDIRTWCLQYLAPYQIPTVIHLVELIPKTPNGKIDRKILQKMELSS